MNQISKLILATILLFTFACSDGTQVSNRIDQLVKDHEIEKLVIEFDGKTHEHVLPKKGEKPEIILEGQFLYLDDEYVNLSHTRTISVRNKVLEIRL